MGGEDHREEVDARSEETCDLMMELGSTSGSTVHDSTASQIEKSSIIKSQDNRISDLDHLSCEIDGPCFTNEWEQSPQMLNILGPPVKVESLPFNLPTESFNSACDATMRNPLTESVNSTCNTNIGYLTAESENPVLEVEDPGKSEKFLKSFQSENEGLNLRVVKFQAQSLLNSDSVECLPESSNSQDNVSKTSTKVESSSSDITNQKLGRFMNNIMYKFHPNKINISFSVLPQRKTNLLDLGAISNTNADEVQTQPSSSSTTKLQIKSPSDEQEATHSKTASASNQNLAWTSFLTIRMPGKDPKETALQMINEIEQYSDLSKEFLSSRYKILMPLALTVMVRKQKEENIRRKREENIRRKREEENIRRKREEENIQRKREEENIRRNQDDIWSRTVMCYRRPQFLCKWNECFDYHVDNDRLWAHVDTSHFSNCQWSNCYAELNSEYEYRCHVYQHIVQVCHACSTVWHKPITLHWHCLETHGIDLGIDSFRVLKYWRRQFCRHNCMDCHAAFSSQKDLDRHVDMMGCMYNINPYNRDFFRLRIFNKLPRSYLCMWKDCSNLNLNTGLWYHIAIKHIEKRECRWDNCTLIFHDKLELKIHVHQHIYPQNLICIICKMDQPSFNFYQSHLKTHFKDLKQYRYLRLSIDGRLSFKCEVPLYVKQTDPQEEMEKLTRKLESSTFVSTLVDSNFNCLVSKSVNKKKYLTVHSSLSKKYFLDNYVEIPCKKKGKISHLTSTDTPMIIIRTDYSAPDSTTEDGNVGSSQQHNKRLFEDLCTELANNPEFLQPSRKRLNLTCDENSPTKFSNQSDTSPSKYPIRKDKGKSKPFSEIQNK